MDREESGFICFWVRTDRGILRIKVDLDPLDLEKPEQWMHQCKGEYIAIKVMIKFKVNQVQQDLNSCLLSGPKSSPLLLGQKVGLVADLRPSVQPNILVTG